MHIGIDGTTLCDPTGMRGAGIEHYTWSVVFQMLREAPEHSFTIFVPAQCSRLLLNELTAGLTNVKIVRSAGKKIPFLSRHVILPWKARIFYRPDVWFAPAGQLPLYWQGPSLVVVHDVSIFRHPEWFPEKNNRSYATRKIVPNSLHAATKLIAVSEFTRQEIEEVFPEERGKIVVIPEAAEAVPPSKKEQRFIRRRMGLTENTVLYLGTIEPRKNLIHALGAFDAFLASRPERVSDTRFVLAGKMGWKSEEVKREIERINDRWKRQVPDRVVRHVGYVSEEEKWALLREASVLLFPSWEEGFGLPVLEAMVVGTPVITTNRGALPEVGGDAVIYVDPTDIEQMSLALTQCLLLPEATALMREEAQKRAQAFTWERSAKAVLEVLEEITASTAGTRSK